MKEQAARRIESAPKYVKLSPKAKRSLIGWLSEQQQVAELVVEDWMALLSHELERHAQAPRNILDRIVRHFSDSREGHKAELRDHELRLGDINAALLQVKSGRVDRAERLLQYEINHCVGYLNLMMSPLSGEHFPGYEDAPQQAYDDGLKAVAVLRYINPTDAAKHQRFFHRVEKHIANL